MCVCVTHNIDMQVLVGFVDKSARFECIQCNFK